MVYLLFFLYASFRPELLSGSPATLKSSSQSNPKFSGDANFRQHGASGISDKLKKRGTLISCLQFKVTTPTPSNKSFHATTGVHWLVLKGATWKKSSHCGNLRSNRTNCYLFTYPTCLCVSKRFYFIIGIYFLMSTITNIAGKGSYYFRGNHIKHRFF